jgi:hypothetical protein
MLCSTNCPIPGIVHFLLGPRGVRGAAVFFAAVGLVRPAVFVAFVLRALAVASFPPGAAPCGALLGIDTIGGAGGTGAVGRLGGPGAAGGLCAPGGTGGVVGAGVVGGGACAVIHCRVRDPPLPGSTGRTTASTPRSVTHFETTSAVTVPPITPARCHPSSLATVIVTAPFPSGLRS